MPEISELSKHIMIEETDDRPQHRDRRSGRPLDVSRRRQGAVRPHAPHRPEARGAAEGAAEPGVDRRAHRGEPRCRRGAGYGPWELSADRANAVRQILEDEGLPGSHVSMVAGKADSQPLFPDDPHIAANRRVTITLMREAPPLPIGFKP